MFNLWLFIKKHLSKDKTLTVFPQEEKLRLLAIEARKERQIDKGTKRYIYVIKTLRGEEEIAEAINAGRKVLKEEVKPLDDIQVTDLHIKNKKTGNITIEAYSFHSIAYDDGYKPVKKVTYYPYKFPTTAAYLLPDDLEAGDRVILDDLIEDIVGASHPWGRYRLDSAEATWNGERFIVDDKSYDTHITFG